MYPPRGEGNIVWLEVKHVESVPASAQSLLDWASSAPVENVRPRVLAVNQYFPRIYRPGAEAIAKTPAASIQPSVALQMLCDRLRQLFRVIEPDHSNLDSHGHSIRELLLLACMEVESNLAAVLRANDYSTQGGSWTTKDYVKLRDPLHLQDYELQLPLYPNVPPVVAFRGWDDKQPTRSLPWYNAYNKTKHSRETDFSVATLRNAIAAVGAAVVVFHAQFGKIHEQKPACRFPPFWVAKRPDFLSEEYYYWNKARARIDLRVTGLSRGRLCATR